MSSKVYEIVTDKILEQLSKGVVPWHKPWSFTSGAAPYNVKTNKPYRGINAFLLACNAYHQTGYLTFKQITELGGAVNKGEHGSIVVFFKISEFEKEDEKTGDIKAIKYPLLRYYTVFNLEQTNGLDKYFKQPESSSSSFNINEVCENVANNYFTKENIALYHKGNQAFYMPSQDSVTLPSRDSFEDEESYYSTLFHEITHSTGHEKRLNRFKSDSNPSKESYSKEELVAEMGACFLLAFCNVEPNYGNSASYIDSWSRAFKSDPKLLVCAANKAQKAADFVLNNNQYKSEDD